MIPFFATIEERKKLTAVMVCAEVFVGLIDGIMVECGGTTRKYRVTDRPTKITLGGSEPAHNLDLER
jgi:hypothetical protein